MMLFRSSSFFTLFLITSFGIVHQACSIIEGESVIQGYIGGEARFMWNATNQQEILSVSWGINKDNFADPLFIYVKLSTGPGKVRLSKDLDETIRKRVAFDGDLNKGFAWFLLKNLTVNDTKEYIARITVNKTEAQVYPVHLVVKTVKPTTGLSNATTTPTEVVSQSTTTAYNKTITTPGPRSANTITHINGHLMLLTIALVVCHLRLYEFSFRVCM